LKMWRQPFDYAEKAARPPRLEINLERCKGCGYCVEFCPRGTLEISKDLGPKGYSSVTVADQSKCLGCGLCEAICPDFAIHLVAEKASGKRTAHG
jgi:2-oxoglutarate ferredoxin oxidoreductase subunit delta